MKTAKNCSISTAIAVASCLTFAGSAQGQDNVSPYDGATPKGLEAGSPTGSYALSGFETVNLYNGGLNVALPLMTIGGRGEVQHTLSLPIQRKWNVVTTPPPTTPGAASYGYSVTPWYGAELLVSGGRLEGRVGQDGTLTCPGEGSDWAFESLTRLTFIGGDGTEMQLVDSASGGAPHQVQCDDIPDDPFNRGKIWKAIDGSATTYVSDTDIKDQIGLGDPFTGQLTGNLFLRNGIVYRIVGGFVTEKKDRNGNKITFDSTQGQLNFVRDPLDRQVTFTLAGGTQTLGYVGYQGSPRSLQVHLADLRARVHESAFEHAGSPKNCDVSPSDPAFGPDQVELFGPTGNSGACVTFDVVSQVELPDGRTYDFFYNDYGEVARIVLPTGGAIEYAWGTGHHDCVGEFGAGDTECPKGVFSGGQLPDGTLQRVVYRRVLNRREYWSGGASPSATPDRTTTYTAAPHNTSDTLVTVTHQGSAGTLSEERHYYHSYIFDQQVESLHGMPMEYSKWNEGREYRTEIYDGAQLLRKTEETWEQRQGAPAWWISQGGGPEPPQDPRVTVRDTFLDDGRKARNSFTFADQEPGGDTSDNSNNQVDVSEYDYGNTSGSLGALLRHTHIDYVDDANYVSAVGGSHLRSLVDRRMVCSSTTCDADNFHAKTDIDYDADAPTEATSAVNYQPPTTPRGNPTSQTVWVEPSGPTITTSVKYDAVGNPIELTDGRGIQTWVDFTDADGEMNANHFAFATEVEVQRTTSASENAPDNFRRQVLFDHQTGSPIQFTDENGVETLVDYGSDGNDELDRIDEILAGSNHSSTQSKTSFSYDDANLIVTTTRDQNSCTSTADLVSQAVFDKFGRGIETRQSTGSDTIKTATEYDALGRAKRVSHPTSGTPDKWTVTDYDALGRSKSVTHPDGASVATNYVGPTTTVTDEALKTRESTSDALGRLVEVVEDPGVGNLDFETTYAYDVLGNLMTVCQKGDGSTCEQTRTFIYDSLGRLKSAQNPEQDAATTFEYDGNGNLEKKFDPRGNGLTQIVYDTLDRPLARTYSGGNADFNRPPDVTFGYDAAGVAFSKGRLTSVSNGYSTTEFTAYDALGRITASKQTTQNLDEPSQPFEFLFSYAYNDAGGLESQTYPTDRTVQTCYDPAGRPISVQDTDPIDGKDYADNFDYADHGAVQQMRLGNGAWENAQFDPNRLQPTQMSVGTTQTGSDLLRLDFSYDPPVTGEKNNGNIWSQTITVGSMVLDQTYDYDKLNRITVTSENGAPGWSRTNSYDPYGNRTVNDGFTQTISPSTNRITAVAQMTAPSYDAAGNMRFHPQIGTMAYDAENKQVSFVQSGKTGTYYYDGQGQRVQRGFTGVGSGTTTYAYDAFGKLAAEYTTASLPASGGTFYRSVDHLGSTRLVTDRDQIPCERRDYYPFGEQIDVSAGDSRHGISAYGAGCAQLSQRFTAKQRDDESSLDYFLARYYSSGLGRFNGVDPDNAGAGPGNPQSWNSYAYANGRPLSLADPDGRAPIPYFKVPERSSKQAQPGLVGTARAFTRSLRAKSRTALGVEGSLVAGRGFSMRGGVSVLGFEGKVDPNTFKASDAKMTGRQGEAGLTFANLVEVSGGLGEFTQLIDADGNRTPNAPLEQKTIPLSVKTVADGGMNSLGLQDGTFSLFGIGFPLPAANFLVSVHLELELDTKAFQEALKEEAEREQATEAEASQ